MTQDFHDIDATVWSAAFAGGMIGAVALMNGVIDGMRQRRFGRILNIASVAAKYPSEARLLSGAPRAALLNYTAAVSRKVARDNVILNTLAPGMYLTEALRDQLQATAEAQGTSLQVEVEQLAKRYQIPSRTLGDPDDIAAFAALLCSRHAAYTVGQTWVFDGGMINGMF